jgi:hypothetical protein
VAASAALEADRSEEEEPAAAGKDILPEIGKDPGCIK